VKPIRGRLERGSIFKVTDECSMWFVIVHVNLKLDGSILIDAIDDCCNNTLRCGPAEIEILWDASALERDVGAYYDKRPIPFEVMWEVMSGQHNDRFSPYRGKDDEELELLDKARLGNSML